MKIFKMFFTSLLVAAVIVLGISQYQMFKELDRYRAMAYSSNHKADETQYMLEMLWQMLPEEINRQVEEAVYEELKGLPEGGKRRVENGRDI